MTGLYCKTCDAYGDHLSSHPHPRPESGLASGAYAGPGGLPVHVLRLPYTRPPLSLNDRPYYRKRARIVRQIRGDVTQIGRALRMEPWPHLHVHLSYVAPDARRRDADNLLGTQKPAVDALTAAGVARGWACLSLIPDDDPEHLSWSPPTIHPPDEHGPRLWLTVTAHPSRPRS